MATERPRMKRLVLTLACVAWLLIVVVAGVVVILDHDVGIAPVWGIRYYQLSLVNVVWACFGLGFMAGRRLPRFNEQEA